MTIPLDQIYQEVILDHNRKPRNFKVVEPATHASHGINPLCGDDYHLYLKAPKGVIEDVGFQGAGCAISKASASMLTQAVKGKSLDEAEKLKENFVGLVTRGCVTAPDESKKALGSLFAFEGVRRFPIRVKCATLIWHALGDAIHSKKEGEIK